MNVRVEPRPGLLLVGMDRPEKRNALDLATVEELHAVLDQAQRSEPAVLVIHSTTPGTFVAGADIAELIERDADDALRAINASLFDRLEAYRWPSIAAIGGCELALACDLRLASPRARFAQPEANLGILAGAGGNWRLAQAVGLPMTRRMLFAGAILDGERALAAGLVDALHEPEELLAAAEALAATIAARSWRALELTKLALRQNRPATTLFDVAAQALLFEGNDKRERMAAFLRK
jgi:enoyl-CoA hydratase